MNILVNVINQKLKVKTNTKKLVSGTQKFIKFEFNLDNAWNDLLVFAQFVQNGKAYNDYLDENNCVYLPPEIVAGEFKLLLYGSGSNVIATTNYLTLNVDENAIIADAQSTEISQSLYDQLVTLVKNIGDKIDIITGGTLVDNLIDPELLYTGTESEVTISRDGDTLIFNGTSTSKGRVTSENLGLESEERYVLEVHSESKNPIGFFFAYVGDVADTTNIYTEYNTPITITVPRNTTSSAFGIEIPNGVTYSNDKYRITLHYASQSAIDTVARASLDAMTTALSTDVGKVLKVKTVANGKVTEWEFGETGGTSTVDTVQDGTITEAKFADALKLKTIKDYVTPEMFGAVGDGLADDTEAIQNAIDNSPNKTILFSKKYIVSSTIVTPATENEKVFLKLNSGAVIKASDDFSGDFVLDIGGSGNRTSIYNTSYITGIDGGTIDTNGVCGGILVERVQMPRITNCSIINVGAHVGLQIDKPSEADSVNSSDAYVENIIVTGEDSNVAECTGIVLNGHDNDIRNIRINFVNIGIVINGSHNRISNAHPLRGASDTENNYSVYETSRAFIVNNNQTYLIDCYSDNFAVGIEVKAGCIFFTYGFTLLWYESYNVTHTFIKIVDDGETLASNKLFWGHVYGADLLFKSVGINTGIDGDFLEASYARNSSCFSELYINNRATLEATDPLLDRRFNTNKIIDYNHDPVTIDSLDQIGEGTSGRVNFSAEASPTGVADIYIFSCTGDSTRRQLTVISPSNNVVYTNIYNGSWGKWKTYQFNNGFTTPASTDAITDLSIIRCGEMGRARFDASVSPTGQSGVFIYECIGGDESRKILIAYFPSNKNRYINSYTGSWTGWTAM